MENNKKGAPKTKNFGYSQSDEFWMQPEMRRRVLALHKFDQLLLPEANV